MESDPAVLTARVSDGERVAHALSELARSGVAVNVDIAKGVFDRFRSLSIWRPSVLVGALLGDLLRYTLAGSVVILLGLILGFRPAGGVLGVLAALMLVQVFSFSVSWIWTWLGLLLKQQESVMMISSMILFFLTFASNIFVNPETMPGWLEAFVGFNPISHAAAAARGLMHGAPAIRDIGLVFLDCGILIAVFGPLTMRIYGKPR